MFGGTDISDLFWKRSLNKLEMFDLKSSSEYGQINDLFWWNDPAYVIGAITTQERHVCIRNKAKSMLVHILFIFISFVCNSNYSTRTDNQCHLTVCEEDSIYEVQAKFFAAYPEKYNDNIVWRKTESIVSYENNTL